MTRAFAAPEGAISVGRRWATRRRWLAAPATVALVVVAGWLVFERDPWPERAVIPPREGSDARRETWPVAFTHDGMTLATSAPGEVSFWDTSNGRERARLAVDGPQARLGGFSPDGRVFAFVVWDGDTQPVAIRRIDTTSKQTLSTITTRVPSAQHPTIYRLAFTSDGGLCAILGDTSEARELVRWDVATGRETEARKISCPVSSGTWVYLSNREPLIAIAAPGSSRVTIWDLAADRERMTLDPPPALDSSSSPTSHFVASAAFSPDGSTLVVSRDNGLIEFWDLATAQIVRTLRAHSRGYASWDLQFTPDGSVLVSRGQFRRPDPGIDTIRHGLARMLRDPSWRPSGEVVALDVSTGRRLGRVSCPERLLLADDGRTLATCGADHVVHLRGLPLTAPAHE